MATITSISSGNIASDESRLRQLITQLVQNQADMQRDIENLKAICREGGTGAAAERVMALADENAELRKEKAYLKELVRVSQEANERMELEIRKYRESLRSRDFSYGVEPTWWSDKA